MNKKTEVDTSELPIEDIIVMLESAGSLEIKIPEEHKDSVFDLSKIHDDLIEVKLKAERKFELAKKKVAASKEEMMDAIHDGFDKKMQEIHNRSFGMEYKPKTNSVIFTTRKGEAFNRMSKMGLPNELQNEMMNKFGHILGNDED